ncbi:hypothetical protein GIB67_032719 [Kingdonia uniflora]|uniref:Uncharacterized protein n=1 Tax=Kingdonia uniflora TaxID=39325 RepID=A0A7J7MWD8_9MAGN|nr:hypothetical protein GIB67_032719 [Kingdonia uniflora]
MSSTYRLAQTIWDISKYSSLEDGERWAEQLQDFDVLQHKELKNQCDYLKRQWKVWRWLINRTGHGYDVVSGTFDWPEEVNFEARKYKTTPLQHRDLLEKLFEGLSTTGDFVWSLGMASSSKGVYSLVVLLILVSLRLKLVYELNQAREHTLRQFNHWNQQSLVKSLIFAFTAQGASSTSANNDDPNTEVANILKDMVSSYEIDNVIFFKSLKFLGGKDDHSYRLMYLALEPEQRASFLETILS